MIVLIGLKFICFFYEVRIVIELSECEGSD